jgi:hypothetical protein
MLNNLETKNLREIAVLYMSKKLETHKFHQLLPDGVNYKKGNNPLVHPLASKDTGYHTVECMTDINVL